MGIEVGAGVGKEDIKVDPRLSKSSGEVLSTSHQNMEPGEARLTSEALLT